MSSETTLLAAVENACSHLPERVGETVVGVGCRRIHVAILSVKSVSSAGDCGSSKALYRGIGLAHVVV